MICFLILILRIMSDDQKLLIIKHKPLISKVAFKAYSCRVFINRLSVPSEILSRLIRKFIVFFNCICSNLDKLFHSRFKSTSSTLFNVSDYRQVSSLIANLFTLTMTWHLYLPRAFLFSFLYKLLTNSDRFPHLLAHYL